MELSGSSRNELKVPGEHVCGVDMCAHMSAYVEARNQHGSFSLYSSFVGMKFLTELKLTNGLLAAGLTRPQNPLASASLVLGSQVCDITLNILGGC